LGNQGNDTELRQQNENGANGFRRESTSLLKEVQHNSALIRAKPGLDKYYLDTNYSNYLYSIDVSDP
jgi:hypothetical protein